MAGNLYNILVPVDFTAKNNRAIVKAIELANSLDCNIHLVHVLHRYIIPFIPVEVSLITPYESYPDRMNSYEKIKLLAAWSRRQLCGRGKIEISILEGPLQKRLTEYIRHFNIDLVVFGLSRHNLLQRIFSSFSITQLAKKTNIPVLAVQPGGTSHHFKKILLPVHNDIPSERIKLATLLARTFKSTVYLLILRKPGRYNEKVLQETREIMHSISTIPVQTVVLEGKNLAKTTLEFASQINADLILINPLKEFNLPGLWNKITNKLLTYNSKIPVLTVDVSNKKRKGPADFYDGYD